MDKEHQETLARLIQQFDEVSREFDRVRAEAIRTVDNAAMKTEPPRYWFVELWFEKRELFKEFMGEVALVGLFLLSFELFHRALGMTSLEKEQIELLNKTHFYLHYGSLVVLSFGFIITVLKSIFRGKP